MQSVSRRIRAVTGFAVLLAAFGAWALDTESIVQSNEAAAVVVWGTRAGSDTVLQGSGCCVARSGYILTVAHQVVGVTGLRARLEDGSERTLDPVAIDEPGDLALLKASEKLPLAARIGDAEELKSGSNLVSIAAPMGLEFSAATGMVSNPNRRLRGRWVIQADIAASPGSSGGPVFDRNGLLVGLIVNRLEREEWVKVVIPINNAYDMLRAHGIPTPADKPSADESQIIPASGLTSAEVSAVQAYNTGVGAAANDAKVEAYQRAVRLLPQFFEAWFNLAVAYTKSDKQPEALKAYIEAESLRPDVLAVQRNLGRLHLGENRLDQAAACFEKAVKLAPDDASAHNDLGEVYRRRNLFEEASAEFSKALSIRPEYPAAHYNFGLTLAAAGHEKAAVEQFSEYLRLAPDASDAAQVKAWIAELSEQ